MGLMLRNRGAILILMINIFILFVGVGLVIPIMPAYMELLHINGTTIGFMVAAFSLSQFLFSPFAGRLSDRLGRKPIIIAGLLVFALSEWMFGMSNTTFFLFFARILGGIGAALSMPAIFAYVADVTTEEERGKAMGIVTAALTTGFIIGPGIGGYLSNFGIRAPFFGAAIAGLIGAIITLIFLPKKVKRSDEVSSEPAIQQGKEFLPLWKQLILSVKEPYFFSLIIVFIAAFGLANYETVFSLYVDHKFGFTTEDIALIITLGSIAGAVVQATIFGKMLESFGEYKIILYSLLVTGIFVILFTFTHTYWIIFAVTFIIFLASDILRPALGTLLSKMTKDEQGYLQGLNSSYTSLGNIVGPILAGSLFDANIELPFYIGGLVMIICFAIALIAGKKYLSPRD